MERLRGLSSYMSANIKKIYGKTYLHLCSRCIDRLLVGAVRSLSHGCVKLRSKA